jgi:hypothetical protein
MARLTRAVFLAMLLLAGVAGPAGATATREYDLKAVFLFHFAEFVEWPHESFAEATTPITVGVLGENPFGKTLEEIVANETVRGRKLQIVHYGTVEEIGPCHILFVSPSESRRLAGLREALGARSVLTVGDGKDFAEKDGMIGFVTARDRLKLRINLAAATAAKLTISSKLLRQAEIVGALRAQP